MIRLVLIVILAVATPARAESVSLSAFLQELGEREGFVITGASHLRGDEFVAPARIKDTERLVERALARYNHLVSYRGGRVSRIDIFGRKGSDVGALPEDYVEPVAAEPAEQNAQALVQGL